MARPQTYEPIILEELKRHPEGVTRKHLAEVAGCSLQQVHKIVGKGKLEPTDRNYLPIGKVGQGDFGAELVGLVGAGPDGKTMHGIATPVGPRRFAELPPVEVPALGSTLQVIGMELDGDRVKVEVVDEHGRHHEFSRNVSAGA